MPVAYVNMEIAAKIPSAIRIMPLTSALSFFVFTVFAGAFFAPVPDLDTFFDPRDAVRPFVFLAAGDAAVFFLSAIVFVSP